MPDKQPLQDQRVLEYVSKETARGFDLLQIKQRLLQAGYSKEYLDRLFSHIAPQQPSRQNQVPKTKVVVQKPSLSGSSRMKRFLLPSIFILAALFILTLVALLSMEGRCADRLCFFEQAADCKSATYKEDLDDISFSYRIIPAKNGCILEKTLITAPSEPEQNRKILEGTSMQCSYSRFDPSYVSTLTGRLDTCQGDLKDALIQAIAASYN